MGKQVKLSVYEDVVIKCFQDWLLWVRVKSEHGEPIPEECMVDCFIYDDYKREKCIEVAKDILRGRWGYSPQCRCGRYTYFVDIRRIIPRFLKILEKLQKVIE